jgi:5-methyltetrahydropteroyltriglutamate--homocysteine methyltransferase
MHEPAWAGPRVMAANPPAPPFRVGQVGSLLRPAELKIARADFEAKRIDAAALRAIEDRLIADAIHKQRDCGMPEVTDGEFRRRHWAFDFQAGFENISVGPTDKPVQFAGAVVAYAPRVSGRIKYKGPTFLDDWRFVASHAGTAVAKQAIPSPSQVHFRAEFADGVYQDRAQLFDDLRDAYAETIHGFGAAGCNYLQIDDTVFAALCDPTQFARLREREPQVTDPIGTYAKTLNAALKARSPGMTIAMHSCRGNFQSTWSASGGYEPVAETIFNAIDIDVYFLEWDSDRAGGLKPLRFLPKGPKRVMLGLVTTKTGELESKDAIRRRIDEATKYVPLSQLGLAPQCGFASTEEGNHLSEDQQWSKLRLCVDLATEVWGAA